VLDFAVTPSVGSPDELAALAVALGARDVTGWSPQETVLVRSRPPQVQDTTVIPISATRTSIQRGDDPLGDIFSRLYSPDQRRPLGATYTPPAIVSAMLSWAATQLNPARIVDPGIGSGRFLVAAGRRFPDAELIGVELDPLAALLARGHLAAAGLAARSTVMVGDYREVGLPSIDGPTLYVGNPPYVRHHLLGQRWKAWLVTTARTYGLDASQLAGLHVHFFLATAQHARTGDVGVFITAAEWLDVNYGRLVRELLLQVLGLKAIHVIEPEALPFAGTATTAVITGFEVGQRPASIGLRRVSTLDGLDLCQADSQARRERLECAPRWTPLTRAPIDKAEGFVELGELCRVHRGQVTGANRVWIAGLHSADLSESVMFPSVTKARELFAAKDVLTDATSLRRIIDLPIDLDLFDTDERRRIDKFLKLARALGADNGFIARNRKAWWSVGLREPAPILATYMARRPPAFVRNLADARHINIAHGLYPREHLSEQALRALAHYLSHSTSTTQGRMYAGGLTKFEPKEMERLLVPSPELLLDKDLLKDLV